MSSLKQDERNQQILRELIQLPGNRKCMDCSAKGPVAAVIDFGTFVCQTCSGIHREFGHRIKMISMATFKPEEIEKLRRIGNENARRIWLAKWTPSEFPEPDPTRHKAIRDFIHAKGGHFFPLLLSWTLQYVAKRWYDAAAKDAVDGKGTPSPASTPAAPAPVVQQQELPRQEPLESILGANLPPLTFTTTAQQPPRPAPVAAVPVPAIARPPEAASDTRARRPSGTVPVQQSTARSAGDDLFGPAIAAAPVTAALPQQPSGGLFGPAEPIQPASIAQQQAQEQKKKDDIMSRFSMVQPTPAPMPFGGMPAQPGPFGMGGLVPTPQQQQQQPGPFGAGMGGMGMQPQQQQGPFGMGGVMPVQQQQGPFGMMPMQQQQQQQQPGPFGAGMGGMGMQPQQTAGPFGAGGYGAGMGGMGGYAVQGQPQQQGMMMMGGYGAGMGMMTPQQQMQMQMQMQMQQQRQQQQQQQTAFGGFASAAPAPAPAPATTTAQSPFAGLVSLTPTTTTTTTAAPSAGNPFGSQPVSRPPAATGGGVNLLL